MYHGVMWLLRFMLCGSPLGYTAAGMNLSFAPTEIESHHQNYNPEPKAQNGSRITTFAFQF